MTIKEITIIAYRLAIVEPRDELKFEHKVWEDAVASIACGLAQENKNFNWKKFVDACRFKFWVSKKAPQGNR